MDNIYDDEDFFTAYAGMERSRKGLQGAGEWHQLRPMFPRVAGRAVLDLGCGYGWHCKYAEEQGAARVLGLDGSRRMIEEARRRNPGPRIEYRACALEDYDYPPEAFGLVVSNLVLHYVRDLEAVYRRVWRTLEPGGSFLFNIEHPVFTSGVDEDWIYDGEGRPLYWPVDGYFSPGPRETRFLRRTVPKQHHTLTQILGGLLSAGFTIGAVEEAMPPADMMDLPGMADELRRPMMLLVRGEKGWLSPSSPPGCRGAPPPGRRRCPGPGGG